MRRLVMLSIVLAAPAMAADGPWTPAPVPSVHEPGVQPAARAGAPSAAVVDTPFSGMPQGSVAADGSSSSNVVNAPQTPSLSGK